METKDRWTTTGSGSLQAKQEDGGGAMSTMDPIPMVVPGIETTPIILCRHEWRIVENFYIEISRTERAYAAYCVKCLELQTVQILLLTKKEK